MNRAQRWLFFLDRKRTPAPGITAPTDIAGLWGWWGADTVVGTYSNAAGSTAVTADGDRVAWQDDRAGSAHKLHLASQGNTRRFTYKTGIQNGLAGWLCFDGDATGTALTTDDSLDTASCSILVACRTATVAGSTNYGAVAAYHGTNGGSRLLIRSTGDAWAGQTNPTDAQVAAATAATSSTSYVIGYSVSGASPKRILFINGNTFTDATAISSPAQPLRVGVGQVNNHNNPWRGYIFEVAVYSPAVSNANAVKVIDYLKAKWGI